MTLWQTFLVVFKILGGLALFLLGMKIMTDSLRLAAGDRLRSIIARGTHNRWAGLTLGTTLGFLVHSTAATVMTVGFINAGLLALLNAMPVFFGANIGTTLSMQLISFRLTDLAYVAVALGFFFQLLYPRPLGQSIGRAVLGFGMIFVGMALMSDAIEPYQEQITPWLTRFDGATWSGMVLGILAAWVFTAIVQSSGATIGIAFVFAATGVFTSLEQVYPIVLGAHLGTPTTALLVSLGCNIEAKRGAVANFLFLVFAVAVGLLLMPLFLWAIPLTTGDLVHQIANLHTGIMVVAALLLMPAVGFVPPMMRRFMAPSQPPPQGTHLDTELIPRPEQALCAVIRELRRSMEVCHENLRSARQLVHAHDHRLLRHVKRNEEVIDELKTSQRNYLSRLTQRYLSRRQALLAQYLIHIVSDLERIGDHVDHLADVAHHQSSDPDLQFDDEVQSRLLGLFEKAEAVLEACVAALDPQITDFPAAAQRIFEARDAYLSESEQCQELVNQRVADHELTPMVGLVFSDYALTLDRLVRHCREIGREMQQPYFGIKAEKLDRIEPPITEKRRPAKRKRRSTASAGAPEDRRAKETDVFPIDPDTSTEEHKKG